jgi:hypothetical protein
MSRIRTEPVASCFPISLTEKWDKFPEKTQAEVLDPACESITQWLPSGKRHSSPVIALEDEGGLARPKSIVRLALVHIDTAVYFLDLMSSSFVFHATIASMESNPSNGLQGFLMRLRMFCGGGWCTEWASRRAVYREQESSSKCFESKERCESLPGGKYRDSLLFIVILLGGTFHLYLLSLFYSSSTASQNKMEENKRDRDYGQWRTGGVYTGGRGSVLSSPYLYTSLPYT